MIRTAVVIAGALALGAFGNSNAMAQQTPQNSLNEAWLLGATRAVAKYKRLE